MVLSAFSCIISFNPYSGPWGKSKYYVHFMDKLKYGEVKYFAQASLVKGDRAGENVHVGWYPPTLHAASMLLIVGFSFLFDHWFIHQILMGKLPYRLRNYKFKIILNVHSSYWQMILETKSLNLFLSSTGSPSYYLKHYSLRSILLKEKSVGFFKISKPLGSCVSWISQQFFECFPSFTYLTIINL